MLLNSGGQDFRVSFYVIELAVIILKESGIFTIIIKLCSENTPMWPKLKKKIIIVQNYKELEF